MPESSTIQWCLGGGRDGTKAGYETPLREERRIRWPGKADDVPTIGYYAKPCSSQEVDGEGGTCLRVFELEEVRRVRDEVVVQRVENAQVHARHVGVAGGGIGSDRYCWAVQVLQEVGRLHRPAEVELEYLGFVLRWTAQFVPARRAAAAESSVRTAPMFPAVSAQRIENG